eukprot:3573456-Amphidinium_carterae.1
MLAGRPGPTWDSCASRSGLGPRLAGRPARPRAPAPHAAAAAQQDQLFWRVWRRVSAEPETVSYTHLRAHETEADL